MRVRVGSGAEIRNYEKHALCFLRVVSRKKEELPVIESSFTLYLYFNFDEIGLLVSRHITNVINKIDHIVPTKYNNSILDLLESPINFS